MGRWPIEEFERDHVVPSDNVMTRVCETRPHGVGLEFMFQSRRCAPIMDMLVAALEESLKGICRGWSLFFSQAMKF